MRSGVKPWCDGKGSNRSQGNYRDHDLTILLVYFLAAVARHLSKANVPVTNSACSAERTSAHAANRGRMNRSPSSDNGGAGGVQRLKAGSGF